MSAFLVERSLALIANPGEGVVLEAHNINLAVGGKRWGVPGIFQTVERKRGKSDGIYRRSLHSLQVVLYDAGPRQWYW